MGKKVEIKDSEVRVKNSKEVNIGVISEKNNSYEQGEENSDNILDKAVKEGKLEKSIAIIFIIAVISLVIVLKSI